MLNKNSSAILIADAAREAVERFEFVLKTLEKKRSGSYYRTPFSLDLEERIKQVEDTLELLKTLY